MSYHRTYYMGESLSLIVYSQIMLCIFKVAKSDVCIGPFLETLIKYARI